MKHAFLLLALLATASCSLIPDSGYGRWHDHLMAQTDAAKAARKEAGEQIVSCAVPERVPEPDDTLVTQWCRQRNGQRVLVFSLHGKLKQMMPTNDGICK